MDQRRNLYGSLMEEVKLRIDCIDRAVRGQTGFPGPIVREFCYGQLRLLCELISLGCLIAHGDIPATYSKRLGKEYSADAIMKELEKLRPHFYPIAIKQAGWTPHGDKKMHRAEGINPPPLPKEALLDLYGHTHKHLHRGNVRKLLDSETPIEMATNFPEIVSWAQKINDQLNVHFIAISEDYLIFCMLRTIEAGGRVTTGVLEKRDVPL